MTTSRLVFKWVYNLVHLSFSLRSRSLPRKQVTRFRMSSLPVRANLYQHFKIKHAGLIFLGETV